MWGGGNIDKKAKKKANIQIDNERVRIIEYSFNKNEEKGFHVHQWDYVVVPQTNGTLLLVDQHDVETTAKLIEGYPC